MEITYKTITVSKKINLGNYESQGIEISAEIDVTDEDELNLCLDEVQSQVTDALIKYKYQHELGKSPKVAKKEHSHTELPW